MCVHCVRDILNKYLKLVTYTNYNSIFLEDHAIFQILVSSYSSYNTRHMTDTSNYNVFNMQDDNGLGRAQGPP